ncbi:MAG TPA: carbohydrate-binding family 9-like protein [Tepidisphaeraceae bacterium]|nr:carbohydrate-binding family 9-like protein [Tepidisphaeraceae bacterium]
MNGTIRRVHDFELDGRGSASAWEAVQWWAIEPLKSAGDGYRTRVKLAYSGTGIYCLYDCDDRVLTSSGLGDNQDLWKEDVVEAFLWTDERHPVYFEYELSPLGAELPLLVPNDRGTFIGWVPWHYGEARRTRRATNIRGGERAAGAAISGWTAEFFIPFALLRGLSNVPPTPGATWRANFYRIDHDAGEPALFAWSGGVGDSFHNINEFGTLLFE